MGSAITFPSLGLLFSLTPTGRLQDDERPALARGARRATFGAPLRNGRVARSTGQAVDPKRTSSERRGVLPPPGRAVSSNPPGADSNCTPTSLTSP
jgi:hypothetical protein